MQTLQVLFCRSRQQNLVGVPFALPCLCLHPTDQSDERVGKHEYNLQQRILSLDELVKYAVMRTAALTNLLCNNVALQVGQKRLPVLHH